MPFASWIWNKQRNFVFRQELNQPAATTTVRPTEFDLERVKPGPKALLLAKALGLVNENGLGNQKLNKEEEEEVVEERVDSKRARRERRMARSKNPDLEAGINQSFQIQCLVIKNVVDSVGSRLFQTSISSVNHQINSKKNST